MNDKIILLYKVVRDFLDNLHLGHVMVLVYVIYRFKSWDGFKLFLASLYSFKYIKPRLKRLISRGLELVLIHTKKLCLASYYIQCSTNIKCTIIRLKPVFLARAFDISELKKSVFNHTTVHFISAESCL